MSEQIKLSGKAAQALWDAGRRDVAKPRRGDDPFVIDWRPVGGLNAYAIATDEPLTTPQAIAVCGVSKLVELRRRNGGPKLRFYKGAWQELDEETGEWAFEAFGPGNNSVCSEWHLVAGDVREEVCCDYGEDCPGHASPDDRPCGYDVREEAECPPDELGPVLALLRSCVSGHEGRSRYDIVHDITSAQATAALSALAGSECRHTPTLPHRTDGETQTFRQVVDELVGIEARLAESLGLGLTTARQDLICLEREGSLVETALVADWHQVYARYCDYLPHRTDSLAEAGRHAEGGGVVEDSDGLLHRIRGGEWQLHSGRGWLHGGTWVLTLGAYILHPADYRDDAVPEPDVARGNQAAFRCERCEDDAGPESAQWAITREGDVATSWACNDHLTEVVTRLDVGWRMSHGEAARLTFSSRREPEPVTPKRGDDLRWWLIVHAPRVALIGAPRVPHRWNEEKSTFEWYRSVEGWVLTRITDDEEGVPESGTWGEEA